MAYKRNLRKIIIIFIKSSQYYAILYNRGDKKNPCGFWLRPEDFLVQPDMVKCVCGFRPTGFLPEEGWGTRCQFHVGDAGVLNGLFYTTKHEEL